MSFEHRFFQALPPWVIEEGWLVHFMLAGALLALRLGPMIFVWACKMLAALAQLFFMALLEVLPAAASGLGQALLFLLQNAYHLAILIRFQMRGPSSGAEQSQHFGSRDGARDDVRREASDFEDACRLLGLPRNGFSASELKRAYRDAIKAAHPDQGGSSRETIAVMNARARINEHFGWT